MEIPLSFGTNGIGVNPLKNRRKKFGLGTLAILLILGVVFTTIGVGVSKASKIDSSWTRVTGTVTGSTPYSRGRSGTTYTPVVSYTVDGQTYTVTSSASSSSVPAIGSTEQVAYNPTSPSDAKVVNSTGTIFGYVFAGIGIAMLIVGPFAFVRSLRRTKDIKNLMQTGQKVQGVITNIQSSGGGSGQNHQNTYRVTVSTAGQSGTNQNYTSDWIAGLGDMAMFDYHTNPIPLDVYVNPTNPEDYYVDITELPSLTPERLMDLVHSATSGHLVNGMNGTSAPSFIAPQQALQPTAPRPLPTDPGSPTPPNLPSTPPQP